MLSKQRNKTFKINYVGSTLPCLYSTRAVVSGWAKVGLAHLVFAAIHCRICEIPHLKLIFPLYWPTRFERANYSSEYLCTVVSSQSHSTECRTNHHEVVFNTSQKKVVRRPGSPGLLLLRSSISVRPALNKHPSQYFHKFLAF